MTKKLCALFLLCSMAMGFSAPAMAAETLEAEYIESHRLQLDENAAELVTNGGFEWQENATTLVGWSFSTTVEKDGVLQNFLGSTAANLNDKRVDTGSPDSQIVKSGNRSLRLTVPEDGKRILAIQGTTLRRAANQKEIKCELSASFCNLSGGALGYIKVSIACVDKITGVSQPEAYVTEIAFGEGKKGEWTTKIIAFTVPSNATSITLQPRINGKGDILFDDISLLQEAEDSIIQDKPVIYEKKEHVAGTPENILALNASQGNWDCEWDQNGAATPWKFFGYMATHTEERFTKEYNHTPGGQQAICQKNDDEKDEAKISQSIPNLIPGATYQARVHVFVPKDSMARVGYDIKWYASAKPETSTAMSVGTKYGKTLYDTGEWQEVVYELVAPYPDEGDAVSNILYIRFTGKNNVVYMDDISFYMVKEPEVMELKSDEAIYYTEWEKGVVEGKANAYHADNIEGCSVRFSLYDGTTPVLTEPEVLPVTEIDGAPGVRWEFSTAFMQANKKNQNYSYTAEVLDAGGQILQTVQESIYRFDRPHYYGEDGIFRKNGKEYNVILGNGCTMDILEKRPQDGGVSVVLLVGSGDVPILEKLDRVQAAGCLAMINMGSSTDCAGSPAMIASTRETVARVKDHPALYGYKMQDEPLQKGTKDEEMLAGYVAIREIDPNHVIYMCDSVVGSYDRLARFADVVDSDRYPSKESGTAAMYEKVMGHAEKATRGRKPYTLLEQAFVLDGYLPIFEEFRHYTYQALFAGASGWGYHSLAIGDNGSMDNYFIDMPIWQEIVNWKESGEQDLMLDCFVNGKYPLINAYTDDRVMWQTYAVGGKLYAFVVNRMGSVADKSGNLTVEIPLTDASAGRKLGGFSATCKWGPAGRKGNIASGADALCVTIDSFTAEVWEITLDNSPDFSDYKAVKYNDITDALWAYQAVARLKDEGILNEETALRFAPLENVKRGDYAMFLVRALELTAKVTTNFVDVLPTAEYYTEVGIGRKLGICQSLGGNTFRPEEPMTREDMMTMTARALRCAGAITSEGADDAFGDNPTVPDWAVLDTASYMHSTFLREKGEGRTEAGGYVTRAEAAVVMDRVRQWKTLANEPGAGDFVTGYANWLNAEEAEVLWDAFLNEEEGDSLENGCWNRTISVNGNRYWLLTNSGETAQSASCSFTENTCTAILQSKSVSAYAEEGELHVMLPPHTVAVYRMAAETNGYLVKDGIYLAACEDGATISLPSAKYGAWYRYNGETADMLSFLENGEEISGLKPGDKLKFFSWEWPSLRPTGRAIEYGKNTL